MTTSGNEERRVGSLRELAQDIPPPRDLWPDIEAQMKAQGPEVAPARPGSGMRRSPNRMRFLALAATIATLAIGIWIGRATLPVSGTSEGTNGRPADGQVANTGEVEPYRAIYVSDPRYHAQRAELMRSLEERLATLPPESRTKVVESLETIRKSMQELEAALGRNPSNALLQELLVSAYQDEMRVLVAVHEASAAGGEI